jgi:cytochrome c biogenesis factor
VSTHERLGRGRARDHERYLNVNQEQPRTHVGVRSLLREDVYVILEEVDVDSETATFTVLLHPGVLWLWVGGILILVGGVLAVRCWRRARRSRPAGRRARRLRATGRRRDRPGRRRGVDRVPS